jgi:hypothetical protein
MPRFLRGHNGPYTYRQKAAVLFAFLPNWCPRPGVEFEVVVIQRSKSRMDFLYLVPNWLPKEGSETKI